MADKIKKTDIFIQKEEGNLMVIDPNKVYDEKGNPVDRYVPQEDLIYFVNLEANPIPRSILDLGEDVNSVRRVVATGKVNYLGPNDGKPLDTTWTEDFIGTKNTRTVIKDSQREFFSGNVDYDYITTNEYDTQLLGIKDIQIQTKPDSLKTSIITIRMVDIRGRALFEKGPASIYSLFFHLPYPQFYLTVKGYYGEAITYQMVLSGQVKTQFENDGDYYVTASFMATNQKLLNDIRLGDAEMAPYLFEYNRTTTNVDGNIKTCKSTKGFDILRQTYQNYFEDGLIDKELAEKPLTIPQLMGVIDRLDVFLENDMFSESDISFFSDISLYGKKLQNFNGAINEWFRLFTNTQNPIPITGTDSVYLELKKDYQNGLKDDIDIIEGNGVYSLFEIFDSYVKELNSIPYFGTPKKISLKTDRDKGKKDIEFTAPSLANLNKSDFYFNKDKKQMRIDLFLNKLENVFNVYTSAFQNIKDQVEDIIVQIQRNELKFNPTLRNVMGVILANTETFLKVMEETHRLAYNQRNHPSRMLAIQSKDNPDSDNKIVYPFPTVYARNSENKPEEFYPNDPAIRNQLKGYDVSVWPEVKIVEEFLSVQMTLWDNVSSDFCYEVAETEVTANVQESLSTIFSNDIFDNTQIYNERSYIELVYRIYNRAIYSVFGTGFSKETIKKLGGEDAKNAKFAINKLLNGKPYFKNGISSFRGLYGPNYLPKDVVLFEDAKQNLLTKSNEKSFEELNSYTVLDKETIKTKGFEGSEVTLVNETKKYEVTGFEPYPFSDGDWVNTNLQVKSNIFNRTLSTKYDSSLNYTYSSAQNDLIDSEYFFDSFLNPLQTPMFVAGDNNYARAFLLLNSIKTRSLTGVYENDPTQKENYFARFLGGDVKEINLIQLLKWGSIWYRYTNYLDTNVDILDEIWQNIDISQYSSQSYTISGQLTNFNYDKTATKFDIGFYPELIVKYLNEVIIDDEFDITMIQSLIDNGNIVVSKVGTVKVSDTGQIINLWRSYYREFNDIIILPSYASNDKDILSSDIDKIINKSVSISWNSLTSQTDELNFDFTTPKISTYDTYMFNEIGGLSSGHIEDLVSLFSYETLEKFKEEFVKFANDKVKTDDLTYMDVYHELIYMNDITNTTNLITQIANYGVKNIDSKFKSIGFNDTMLITLHKPMNIDLATISSFTNVNIDNQITYSVHTTTDNNLFEKIIGKSKNSTVQNKKLEFFQMANIDASESNMKKFKGIVNIWAKWSKDNPTGTIENFKIYLSTFVTQTFDKLDVYVNELFTQLNKLIDLDDTNDSINSITSDISGGVELQKITYRHFKNINDTWIGGFNWDKVNLANLFRYMNYLNEPIGEKFIVDLTVLKDYYNSQNKGKSIGSFISYFLKKNSLSEPMSFASNINFYGNLTNDVNNVINSKKVANSIFGIHTEVRKNGLPGFVVFFRSNVSEYLKIKRPDFGYKDDSMDLSSNTPNPLSTKEVDIVQVRQGGRGIAFNVDFGIQHQNMFNDFSIQSYDGTKSGEELIITEQIANLKKGSTASSISTNLLDVMKTRVYSCTIKMLGNAMIQPFMYFNLRYIPIYSGTYMILTVEHTLSPDSGMLTTFTGVRVSKSGISNIDKGMIRARKNLLDNLIDKLIQKTKKLKEVEEPKEYDGNTEHQGGGNKDNNGRSGPCKIGSAWGNLPNFDVPRTSTKLTNSELKDILISAANKINVSQTVRNNLAKFTFAVSKQEQGRGNGVRFYFDNPFGLHVDGGASSVFKDNVKGYFCPLVSDGYVRATAMFHNPDKGETVKDGIVMAYYSFMIHMKRKGENYFSDPNFWTTSNGSDATYLASIWAFNWNTSYAAVTSTNGGKGKLITDYNVNGKNIVYYKGAKLSSKDYTKIPSNFKSFISTFNKS